MPIAIVNAIRRPILLRYDRLKGIVNSSSRKLACDAALKALEEDPGYQGYPLTALKTGKPTFDDFDAEANLMAVLGNGRNALRPTPKERWVDYLTLAGADEFKIRKVVEWRLTFDMVNQEDILAKPMSTVLQYNVVLLLARDSAGKTRQDYGNLLKTWKEEIAIKPENQNVLKSLDGAAPRGESEAVRLDKALKQLQYVSLGPH